MEALGGAADPQDLPGFWPVMVGTRHRSGGISPVFQREFIYLDEGEFGCFQLIIAFQQRKHLSENSQQIHFLDFSREAQNQFGLATFVPVKVPLGTQALLQSSSTGEHRTHGEETHFETGLWFSFSRSFPHLFLFLQNSSLP